MFGLKLDSHPPLQEKFVLKYTDFVSLGACKTTNSNFRRRINNTLGQQVIAMCMTNAMMAL